MSEGDRMRAGIFAAALALAVVTAGCGGGTNKTPRSTRGGRFFVYTFWPATKALLGVSQNSFGPLTLGVLPAGQFMAVSSDSQFLYISSPTTGKIAVSAIGTDGRLGAVTIFTVGATPSVMLVDPQVRFLYVTDPPTNAIRVFSLSGGAISSQVSG